MNRKMQKSTQPQAAKSEDKPLGLNPNEPDDRYPGSYFRVPGPFIPGKTTWSIAK